MAINFKLLVESLLTEQFDPNKTFKDNIEAVLKHVYPDTLLAGGNVNRNDLYSKFFVNYGANIQSGGSTYVSDDFLRSNRFFWPVIDIGNRILYSLNNNKNLYINLVSNTQTFDQFITANIQDPNAINQIKQDIETIINDFKNIPAGRPQEYTHFTSYRLNKLNTDLSQLTIQRYNGLTVLNAITEIALLRGIKDKTLIEKVLSYPVDYLTGSTMIPEKFDSEIVNIGGVLLTYYKNTLQSTGIPADQLNTVGTTSGANTQYGKEYLAFIKGSSTLPVFQNIKKLGDLQSAAPNVYAKIQEYTLYIKRGDKPSIWQKAGKAFAGALKGLEDIGSTLERM
jgi:hypothetical protein